MDQGNNLKKTPFILVTGFLGSGKTSLLMDMVGKYSSHFRLALIQNEFAPGHVDGFTLKRTSQPFDLLEINNGSVFCACLLGDFITRLAVFIEQNKPDLIILEATGLADPISLVQVLEAPELSNRIYLAGSWCVVDATNFHHVISSVTRATHQVRVADIVFINKTDLVRNTSLIHIKVLEINPYATIIETTFGSTDKINLPNYLIPTHGEEKRTIDLQSLELFAEAQQEFHNEKVFENRPNLSSCVVRSNRFFHEGPLREFILRQSMLQHRIKGYIRIDESYALAIQSVFSVVSFKLITGYFSPGELIAIGPNLNKMEFSKQLLALQKR
jgi:G3E family GTPase